MELPDETPCDGDSPSQLLVGWDHEQNRLVIGKVCPKYLDSLRATLEAHGMTDILASQARFNVFGAADQWNPQWLAVLPPQGCERGLWEREVRMLVRRWERELPEPHWPY